MDIVQQTQVFRKMLPQQLRLREIARLTGKTEGRVFLDISMGNPVLSAGLRRMGGTWHTIAANERNLAPLQKILGNNVATFRGNALPFEDKMFDAVIVSDLLERVPDDNALVTECHRVLKPAGNLIVDVAHLKKFSILRSVEAALSMRHDAGFSRPGYTEADLFHLLKNGFDVHTVRSHTHTFVYMVDIFVRLAESRLSGSEGSLRDIERSRLYAKAYPFYWLAFQLVDIFLVFSKGFFLTVVAKRHAWRPRETPVLKDGRSISEAVLSKIKR